ncbi:hypothetical protein [Burkholderia gladioli]|uniref:hypothetical protein n=1 Tax=Burkholderia gladioli TaxID=28095 RepID=UPI0016413FBC|nr:hypothetical protein [Burkholderia gladioli]
MSDLQNAARAFAAVRKVLIDGNADGVTVRELAAVGADPWLAHRNWEEQSVREACWLTVVRFLPDDLQQHLVELGFAESNPVKESASQQREPLASDPRIPAEQDALAQQTEPRELGCYQPVLSSRGQLLGIRWIDGQATQ